MFWETNAVYWIPAKNTWHSSNQHRTTNSSCTIPQMHISAGRNLGHLGLSTFPSHLSVVMDLQLWCMAEDFLKSLRKTCHRCPKFCQTDYVVEHPVGVTSGGFVWSEGYPKFGGRVFFAFHSQVTKVKHFVVIEESSSLHNIQRAQTGPEWGSQEFAQKFCCENKPGQDFWLNKYFYPGSPSLVLPMSMLQLNYNIHNHFCPTSNMFFLGTSEQSNPWNIIAGPWLHCGNWAKSSPKFWPP